MFEASYFHIKRIISVVEHGKSLRNRWFEGARGHHQDAPGADADHNYGESVACPRGHTLPHGTLPVSPLYCPTYGILTPGPNTSKSF